MKLLDSDDEARPTSIAAAVTRDLFWLIPHDRGVYIAVRDRTVTVTLGEPVAGSCHREPLDRSVQLRGLLVDIPQINPKPGPDGSRRGPIVAHIFRMSPVLTAIHTNSRSIPSRIALKIASAGNPLYSHFTNPGSSGECSSRTSAVGRSTNDDTASNSAQSLSSICFFLSSTERLNH